MLAYPVPPGYQRQNPVLRPKLGQLGPWQDAIDAYSGTRQDPAKKAAAHRKAYL
jgi:hypothetical protein